MSRFGGFARVSKVMTVDFGNANARFVDIAQQVVSQYLVLGAIRRDPAVAALLACLVLSGYLYLPKLAGQYLPVELIRHLGFEDFQGRISQIGIYRAAAGPFVFGSAQQPAIVVRKGPPNLRSNHPPDTENELSPSARTA